MSLPIWARVGAKVVCVTKMAKLLKGEAQLVVGDIYTIRTVEWAEGDYGFTLVEVVNPALWNGTECLYSWYKFRPLVTIEDDLEAHFTNLLRVPTNQPVDA